MQGYAWSSNQRPAPNYQDRPPPQYQERPPLHYQEQFPPKYQERPPLHYQEQFPPKYQERPPIHYQEQFPPKYQDVRNEQPNMSQAQFNTQLYNTPQTRYSNGQQDVANHLVPAFQPNLHGYNTQTNRAHPQYQCEASNTEQHYPPENLNTNGYYAQFGTQSNTSSPQNYRNTGHNQAHMYWSPQSDHGSSVGNNRGWSFHIYNNGSFCLMNNQQQLQPSGTAPRHHPQQQFSRRHSGKHHHKHHRIRGYHSQSSSWSHKNGVSQRVYNNQAQSQTAASYTSCNPTTPPSGAQNDSSLPSGNLNQSPVNHQPELRSKEGPDVSAAGYQNNQSTGQQSQGTNSGTYNINETSQMRQPSGNLNQSPVIQNQPELRSNEGPDVSATGYQNNQSIGQQSQDTNSETYNINETSQMTQTNEAQPQPHSRFENSLIYKLLRSKGNEQGGKQQSDERIAHHNTCSEQSEVCATNRTDHRSKEPFTEPSAQCTVEPPSKRMKYAVVQRDYWNKEISVPKDRSDFGVQSAQPGTHQTSRNENIPKGMSQHNIQYSTDPADCLEAVFALQKVSQQAHKAIAIVPPISQQTSNTAQMADTSPKKADSPPLKIDSVWSVVEESDAQKTADDQLSEFPSPTAQQEAKSLEIETTSNIVDSDICSTSPVECQNNVQQGDCDSSDASCDLSSVPVVKYTLGELMNLVKSLEMTELSAKYPEKSENFTTILNLYWNGNQDYLVETLISFRMEVQKHSSVEIVRDYETVVFESIETENLKKLAHCDVLNNEMYSSSEEFKSSWLNVDGEPADIDRVLSEPLSDDMTGIQATSQLFSGYTVGTSTNLGVNSLKDVPEVSSDEKSVNPDTCGPTTAFTPQSGNDREEIAAENNGHSFLSSVSSEKETFKKQEDIKQNHNFNTKPSDNSPEAERSTEKLTDCSNEIEVVRQDHYEQTRHNVSVSDLLPLSPIDNVSDGVKNSEVSFSTETLCNSKDTWQIEDISEDENPGKKEGLNNSSDIGLVEDISEDENPGNKEGLNNSDIWLVEDISEDENTGNKEVLPNSSDTWLVEDISEDENTGNKEVLPNSSDTWQVEDISEDENPDNKGTHSNSSDICVVEDVFNDENSSDDSLLMEITVLSSEDAKTFFQHLEDEPECSIKTTTSKFDCPDLVLCFDVPSQPNHEYNRADTCSLCGTKIAMSNSTNVTDRDGGDLCPQCWEQAPLLELEEEPCYPMINEADVLGSPAKSNKQGQDCFPPRLKLEIKEIDVASTKEFIANERLTGQRSDHMVKSDLGENCCPPCLDLKVKEPTVASLKESIGNERLTGQKCDDMVKSEQSRTLQSLDLKVKELTITSTKKCIDGLTGQKRDSIEKSELEGNCCPPCLELKVNEPTVASTGERIDKGLTEQKSLLKSELRPNCSPPSVELQVKVSNVSSPEECTENERLTGQKRDSTVKSELGQNCRQPSVELKVNEPTVASTEKRTEDERLMGQKRERFLKSEPRHNCSSASLESQVKVSKVGSPEECVADEGLSEQKSDSMVKSVTQKVPAEQEIQPNKQKNDKTKKNGLAKNECSKPPKHKLKSGSTRTGSDDSELFAPDIVVKNLPQKEKHPGVIAKKRPSVESQDCSKVKKFKEHRQERQDYPDRTSPHHRENLQKVTEKVPGHSNDTPPHGSKQKLELHGILSVNKTKRTEPKKVRFDLYGSNRVKQIYAHGRRFSAPATITVSDSCKDYSDVLSAKQKVHNQWSSTFIPKTKSLPPRTPQKKKPQKCQDLLKSNVMSALKNHLTHRANLHASSERETNHFRKPVFHHKLTKTLSG